MKKYCGGSVCMGQGPSEKCGNFWGTSMIQCASCKAYDLARLEMKEFPDDELDELDIATIMLRNHGYNHLADSVALAKKALTK